MNSILIESNNAGWKFTCKNHNIDIETGLYFGMKNKYLENKNILVSGLTTSEEQKYFWEISKDMKIKSALISVSNKDKLKDILKELKKYKIKVNKFRWNI